MHRLACFKKVVAYVNDSLFSHLICCLWFANTGMLELELEMFVKKE